MTRVISSASWQFSLCVNMRPRCASCSSSQFAPQFHLLFSVRLRRPAWTTSGRTTPIFSRASPLDTPIPLFSIQSLVQVLDLPCAEQGLCRRHSRSTIHLVTNHSKLERPHIFQGTRVVVRNDMWYLFGRHDEAATQGPIFVKLNHLAPNFSRGLLRSVS